MTTRWDRVAIVFTVAMLSGSAVIVAFPPLADVVSVLVPMLIVWSLAGWTVEVPREAKNDLETMAILFGVAGDVTLIVIGVVPRWTALIVAAVVIVWYTVSAANQRQHRESR